MLVWGLTGRWRPVHKYSAIIARSLQWRLSARPWPAPPPSAFVLKLLSQSCFSLTSPASLIICHNSGVITLSSAGQFRPPTPQLARWSSVEGEMKDVLTRLIARALIWGVDWHCLQWACLHKVPPWASVIQSPLIHVTRCPVSPAVSPRVRVSYTNTASVVADYISSCSWSQRQ